MWRIKCITTQDVAELRCYIFRDVSFWDSCVWCIWYVGYQPNTTYTRDPLSQQKPIRLPIDFHARAVWPRWFSRHCLDGSGCRLCSILNTHIGVLWFHITFIHMSWLTKGLISTFKVSWDAFDHVVSMLTTDIQVTPEPKQPSGDFPFRLDVFKSIQIAFWKVLYQILPIW